MKTAFQPEAFALVVFFAFSAFAPTGGNYQIEQSVIASGHGGSAGGTFALDSTSGQTLAGGFIQAAPYAIYSGFHTPSLAPTAAQISIGGRVMLLNGRGIRNARVRLTAPNGETRFGITGPFGHYHFNEVPVGETYMVTVFSKRFVFNNPTHIVTANEELNNLDFVAAE